MDVERASNQGISRRSVTKAMAWSAPVIAVAATVPVVAASLRKDPGINGWVSVGEDGSSCDRTLEFNSKVSGTGPDGAPYGLYIYDVEPEYTFSNAQIVVWVLGEESTINWSTRSNHSSAWSGPVRGAAKVKKDGHLYTPYVWSYTDPILASQVSNTDSDGVPRLKLKNFHVRGKDIEGVKRGGWLGGCNVAYWVERRITIDVDGAGPLPSAEFKFQRKRGDLGDDEGYGNEAQMKAKSVAPLKAKMADEVPAEGEQGEEVPFEPRQAVI